MPVYPRLCGEQIESGGGTCKRRGLSPPVRGTDRPAYPRSARFRFIPACAGEQLAHPGQALAVGGLSPPVRGTGLVVYLVGIQHRFIPACAGNRASYPKRPQLRPVYPRLCGEQGENASFDGSITGLSPPVRGTDGSQLRGCRAFRFIPACAGNRAARRLFR